MRVQGVSLAQPNILSNDNGTRVKAESGVSLINWPASGSLTNLEAKLLSGQH